MPLLRRQLSVLPWYYSMFPHSFLYLWLTTCIFTCLRCPLASVHPPMIPQTRLLPRSSHEKLLNKIIGHKHENIPYPFLLLTPPPIAHPPLPLFPSPLPPSHCPPPSPWLTPLPVASNHSGPIKKVQALFVVSSWIVTVCYCALLDALSLLQVTLSCPLYTHLVPKIIGTAYKHHLPILGWHFLFF